MLEEREDVEQPIISGVAHDRSEAKVTVVGVPDHPGEAAAIFETVAGAEVNIDMIVQNVSAASTGRTDITFTLPRAEGDRAMKALAARQGGSRQVWPMSSAPIARACGCSDRRVRSRLRRSASSRRAGRCPTIRPPRSRPYAAGPRFAK